MRRLVMCTDAFVRKFAATGTGTTTATRGTRDEKILRAVGGVVDEAHRHQPPRRSRPLRRRCARAPRLGPGWVPHQAVVLMSQEDPPRLSAPLPERRQGMNRGMHVALFLAGGAFQAISAFEAPWVADYRAGLRVRGRAALG